MPTYAYRFPTHWTTTDEELVGYVERFEVTPAELQSIVDGQTPDQVIGIDPISPEPPPPEEPPLEPLPE